MAKIELMGRNFCGAEYCNEISWWALHEEVYAIGSRFLPRFNVRLSCFSSSCLLYTCFRYLDYFKPRKYFWKGNIELVAYEVPQLIVDLLPNLYCVNLVLGGFFLQ